MSKESNELWMANRALTRRLEFLETRRDNFGKANSYDIAEMNALRVALRLIAKEREKYTK